MIPSRVILMCVSAALATGACQSPEVYVGSREGERFDRTGRVDFTVTECGAQFLFIPLFVNDRFERAMDQIGAAAQGRHISDVRVREAWMYGVFGTLFCTEVIAATWPLRD